MRFKRGNKAKITRKGEYKDREVVILGSYYDQYDCGSRDSYTVIFYDSGGEMSWVEGNELELINKGGEYLIKKMKAKAKAIEKQDTDINYLLPLLDKGRLSSTSILYLFGLIGFDSSFNRNGEYFILFRDWEKLHPLFVKIKYAETIKEVEDILTPEALQLLNINNAFNAMKGGEKR